MNLLWQAALERKSIFRAGAGQARRQHFNGEPMRLPYFALRAVIGGVMMLSMGATQCQDYPTRPVRIIAASAGSSGDFAARLIAQGITGSLGQQVIVENRGGNVTVSGELVAKAPP